MSERLAFGSAIKTKTHVKQLQALGITHVINLRWSQNNANVRQFPHAWLRFHDDKKSRPHWFYRRALKFYSKATKQRDTKLFVMCHHGMCRSASLVYFFLRASGIGEIEARSAVLIARSRAHICQAYRECGEEFLTGRQPNNQQSKPKRKQSWSGEAT